jgi:hypothetical protein
MFTCPPAGKIFAARTGGHMANSSMKISAIEALLSLPDSFDYINEKGGEISETMANKVDDCFASMSSDWQVGNYPKIVELADEQPIYCLCDIRICVYYLYSIWVSKNDTTSEKVLNILTNILNHGQNPWRVSLTNQTDKSVYKILSNSVTLLLRKIIDHLEHPNNHHRIWQETPDRVLRELRNLHITINEKFNEPIKELENVFVSIKKCYSLLEQQSHGKNDTVKPEANVIENNTGKRIHTDAEPTKNNKQIVDDSNLVNQTLFKPSHALKQLFRHILLFQDLINQKDQLKAAVVLNDLQQELDNFNPLHYFPEYFTSFARLRAKHAADLEPLFCQQDSYQWKVLSECYKTNIDAFLTIEDDQTGLDKPACNSSQEDFMDKDYHE